MVRRIVWMNLAKQRLHEISDYLKKEAGARVAKKIRDGIYARPEMLVDNPQAGQCEESLAKYPHGFRYLVEGNYKIVYFVTDTEIVISTIFDCRRDPTALRESVIKRD
ncbi:MAG: type II toxin-antitoxin system RelE/ParE family toxin [Alistipes sp.]|jgi:plasmid stabilization system protein ParE|nr:type II toxin-antitoxin system RelE/ParE family toxin [Alistipes sp.]